MTTILLFTFIFIYSGLILFALLFADSMIFQPPPPSYPDSDRVIKLETDDETIAATYLPNNKARYTILYSHGNAIDLGQLYPILEEIRTMGFSVFAYDYRGYGLSSGSPSEEKTYSDMDTAYRYLTTQLKTKPENIIALGQSLGGAVSADLASRKPLGGLIIESSFVTAYRVLTRVPLLPFDQYKTIKKIKQVQCPVLIIHGKNDQVIPFWHGERLFAQANKPKQKFWVDNAGHNNLLQLADRSYEKALQKFISLIENYDK